jgi:F5/8 type C domain
MNTGKYAFIASIALSAMLWLAPLGYAQPPANGSYPIVRVSGDTPEAANKPTNVIDGDYNTRWSAEFKDNTTAPTLTLDLGEEKIINNVLVAWYRGDTRISYIAIQAFLQEVGFVDIGGGSSVHDLGLQTYPTNVVSTRFIRIQGFGNDSQYASVNGWTSITEVGIGFDTEHSVTAGFVCR